MKYLPSYMHVKLEVIKYWILECRICFLTWIMWHTMIQVRNYEIFIIIDACRAWNHQISNPRMRYLSWKMYIKLEVMKYLTQEWRIMYFKLKHATHCDKQVRKYEISLIVDAHWVWNHQILNPKMQNHVF